MTRVPALLCIGLLYGGHAVAGNLSCFRDPRTDATGCVNVEEVREAQGIRYAKFYSGGPTEVGDTGYTIATNCRTGVTHLKDRRGVSFAGGAGNETEMLTELRNIVCGATLRRAKK